MYLHPASLAAAAGALGLALTLAAPPASAADAPGLCASGEDAARVRALYATVPAPPPFFAAPQLGLSEALVLSAMPKAYAVGVPAGEFMKVWDSVRTWPRGLTLFLKGGQVFEVTGRIPAGEWSKVSKNFNLQDAGSGLGGHLRPDLMSAIYAVSLQGRDGMVRGVMFLDAQGRDAFGVYLPEGQDVTAAEIDAFEATRTLLETLPSACP
jgi:putative heme iron utilization protein